MSEQKGFWNNATVSAIASGIFLSILTAVAHFAGITVASAIAWLKRVAAFWSAEVTLSRWAFWSWVLVTALASLFIALQIYFNLQEPDAPVRADKKPVSFADYKTDVFFSLRWRWTVYSGGSVGKMSVYCPKCDYELSAANVERGQSWGEHICRCEHCNYYCPIGNSTLYELSKKAEKAAERKIRTGEWKKTAEA
jgi:hypothetical protein